MGSPSQGIHRFVSQVTWPQRVALEPLSKQPIGLPLSGQLLLHLLLLMKKAYMSNDAGNRR